MSLNTQPQAFDEVEDADVTISVAEEPQKELRGLRPLQEAAYHLSNAIRTDELRETIDELADGYTDIKADVVNDLQQARTRISDAILDLRRGIAPTAGAIVGDIVTKQVERGVGYAERVVTDRGQRSEGPTP